MITVKCIEKIRNKSGVITHYRIQDTTGDSRVVTAELLKAHIFNKDLNCVNLTLTSNNRLIDKAVNTHKVTKSNNQDILNTKDFCKFFGINYEKFKERIDILSKQNDGWLDNCSFVMTFIRIGRRPCEIGSPDYWDTYDTFEYNFYKEEPDCGIVENAKEGDAIFSRYIYWGTEQMSDTTMASIGFSFSKKDFNESIQRYIEIYGNELKSEFNNNVKVKIFSGVEFSCTLEDVFRHRKDFTEYIKERLVKC